jgi:DNA-binding CsgD family transcriptional regulator
MNAASRHAAQRIRVLATMESGGPGMLPALLGELQHVLGFDSAAYYHLDARGEARMISEDPEVLSVIPTYLDARMQAAERAVARPYSMARRADYGPQLRAQLITVPYAQFLRSDYYNVLLRPIRIHDCVSLVTRLPDGTATGALKFYRRTGSPDFRREELGTLAQLEPFLAAALQATPETAAGELHRDARALFITCPEGRLLWCSQQARHLALRAFGGRWDAAGELPVPLRRALARLAAVQRPTRRAGPAALPRVQWRGPDCHYVVNARWLEGAGGAGAAVALELERRVSRRHHRLRRLAGLRLPARQFEIAAHLTGGLSEPRMAEKMGITRNTLVYHRRRLYERLGVHTRAGLLEWLDRPAAEEL